MARKDRVNFWCTLASAKWPLAFKRHFVLPSLLRQADALPTEPTRFLLSWLESFGTDNKFREKLSEIYSRPIAYKESFPWRKIASLAGASLTHHVRMTSYKNHYKMNSVNVAFNYWRKVQLSAGNSAIEMTPCAHRHFELG